MTDEQTTEPNPAEEQDTTEDQDDVADVQVTTGEPDADAPPEEKPEGDDVLADKDPETQEPEEEPKLTRTQRQRLKRRAALEDAQKRASESDARAEALADAVQGLKEPQEAEFENPDEFIAAKAAFRFMKQQNDLQVGQAKKEQERTQQAVSAELQASWNDQQVTAREKYQDFDQVLGNLMAANLPGIDQGTVNLMMHSDKGADIAYHLGANLNEAIRISNLPPLQQAVEIGKIEAGLQGPKPKKLTAAPKPVKPLSGGEKPPKTIHDIGDGLTGDAAYLAMKDAEDMAADRRRA